MKICSFFRCNSYGPWTPTKCNSISFNNKVCCDIAYFNTKMSYLSDFKRTKSKTLRTAKQTEDELNKSAVSSSANNTNKRLTFLKFDYRKYSNFLLLYKSTCHFTWNGHRERHFSHWYLQLHTRLAERYRWRCADLHSDWFHAVMTHSPFSVQFIEKILNRCKYFLLIYNAISNICIPWPKEDSNNIDFGVKGLGKIWSLNFASFLHSYPIIFRSNDTTHILPMIWEGLLLIFVSLSQDQIHLFTTKMLTYKILFFVVIFQTP